MTQKQPPYQKENQTFEAQMSDQWLRYLLAAILLVTCLIYFKASGFDFLFSWDDNGYITNNEHIKNLTWGNIRLMFSSFYVGNYQPVTMLYYALVYKLGAGDAFLFHLGNILFHAINTLLVFVFVRRISPEAILTALVTAAFFGVHPMHVESVAWVSESKDVLYAFFFLISLIFYVDYVKSAQIRYLLFAGVFFILSCLSKSAAVVLPLVMLLFDYYLGRTDRLKVLAEKIPFFALSILIGIVALRSQKSSIDDMSPVMSLLEHVSIVSFSFMSYLIKAFIPVNLSAVYTYPVGLGHGLPFIYTLSVVVVALVLFFMWYARKWGKETVFGILFMIINLLLVLQIIPVGAATMADRYTYIPYIGLFFLIGHGCSQLAMNPVYRKPVFGFLAMAFMAFSALSYARISVWENDDTLFTDVLAKYPNSYISHHDRGVYYVQHEAERLYAENPQAKRVFLEKGITDFEQALPYAVSPGQKVSSYTNLGYARYALGDFKGAINAYDRAIQTDSHAAAAYLNRAYAQFGLKDYHASLADFNKAIELNPSDSNAIKNRLLVKSVLDTLKKD